MTSYDGLRSAIADPVDRILEASVAGSFSRLGFQIRSRLLPEFSEVPPPLAGRTVLITGATSGIGLSAAIRLASHGASVHFLARSRQRAERTRRQIGIVAARAGYDPDSVSYGIADLDRLESVGDFVSAFAAGHDRLDVLIHNAGAIHPAYQRDDAGLELTAAGQVVAPFLLTYQLFGLLARSAPSRVITVSSGGMYAQGLDLPSLQLTAADYKGVTAYARAKRAQVALSAQWARRAAGTGVAFHAMHPGWVRTPGLARSLPTFSRLIGPVLRTPDQGADTMVWLAAADPARLSTGRFWHDRRLRPVYRIPGARPGPPDAGQRLWDWTAEQAGVDASGLPVAESSS
jgi:NAD(P)-dependent dehydrogenase (short-subunit alcohol dehydrogenase family)